MQKYIQFIIYLFILASLGAQESGTAEKYFLKNYSPNEYKAHMQNWYGIKDNRGILYFANGDGLMEYDGIEWRVFPLRDKNTPRCLVMDSTGRIFVGSDREFGYFELDKNGDWIYNSLSKLLPPENLKYKTILDVYLVKNYVYFTAYENIFQVSLKNESFTRANIKVWQTESTFYKSFVFNDKFYIYQNKVGLCTIKNDSIILAKEGEKFKEPFTYSLILDKEKILIGQSLDNSIYYFPESNKPIEKANFKISNSIKNKQIWDAKVLSSGDIGFILTSNGLIILSKEGQIQKVVNETNGLRNDKIRHFTEDQQGNLWLALNNGITKLENSSPISFFDKESGLIGTPEDLIYHNKTLYIATHKGIQYFQNNNLKSIPDYDKQVWCLLSFSDPNNAKNKSLLVGLRDGVFEINNLELGEKIQNTYNSSVFCLKESQIHPSRVYVGYSRALGAIEYRNNRWESLGWVEGITENVRSIVELKNGEIWLGTFRDGIVRIIPSENTLNPKEIVRYTTAHGLPSLKNLNVFEFNNSLVFGTEKGLYVFNSNNNTFEPNQNYNLNFIGEKEVFSFIETSNGDIITSGLNNSKGEIGIAYKNSDNTFSWYPTPFYRIPEMMILALYPQNDSTIWFGGSEGLFKYTKSDPSLLTKKYYSFIRRVKLNNDSIIHEGNYVSKKNNIFHSVVEQPEDRIPTIKYQYNSIYFKCSSVSYFKSDENRYMFYLDGYDNDWSSPSTVFRKNYTNLKEGRYTFQVKSINIYGIESEIASYKFVIQPPWHRTIIAYISYLIIGIFILWIIIALNTRILKKENVKLENIIQERTREIAEQNEEIIAANEEISNQKDSILKQNIELEKLSIVASKTGNSVIILTPETEFEWANASWRKIYECTLDEFKQKNGEKLIQNSNVKNIKNLVDECINSKKPIIYETQIENSCGEKIWLRNMLSPVFDSEENLFKLVIVGTDISKIKELEQYKEMLTQMIVHDLKNPLNLVIGYSSLSPSEKRMQSINSSGMQMLNLVENILDVQKFEEKKMKLNKEKCSINFVIEKAISNVQYLANQKEIVIHNNTETIEAYFDQDQIIRVIINLLTNAIKFSKNGDEININSEKVEIDNKSYCKILVIDFGEGVPSEHLDKIFDKYAQAIARESGRTSSTGLGLTYCKFAVEAHNGIIGVNSELDKGSIFYFTLPL